jgi:hypothetical protein
LTVKTAPGEPTRFRFQAELGRYRTHESCRNRPDDVGAGALQRFCEDKAGLVYIPPGCPLLTGYIESFDNRLGKECLNRNHWNTLFFSRPAWSSATSNTNTTTDKQASAMWDRRVKRESVWAEASQGTAPWERCC